MDDRPGKNTDPRPGPRLGSAWSDLSWGTHASLLVPTLGVLAALGTLLHGLPFALV